jgi:hypothetical protein
VYAKTSLVLQRSDSLTLCETVLPSM